MKEKTVYLKKVVLIAIFVFHFLFFSFVFYYKKMDKKYLQKQNSKSLTNSQGFTDELKRLSRRPKERGEGREGRVKERKKKKERKKNMRWKE